MNLEEEGFKTEFKISGSGKLLPKHKMDDLEDELKHA